MSSLPTLESAGRLPACLPAIALACERSAARIFGDVLTAALRRAAWVALSRLIAARLAARARRELERMDDRVLRDMGLERISLLALLERGRPRLTRTPRPH